MVIFEQICPSWLIGSFSALILACTADLSPGTQGPGSGGAGSGGTTASGGTAGNASGAGSGGSNTGGLSGGAGAGGGGTSSSGGAGIGGTSGAAGTAGSSGTSGAGGAMTSSGCGTTTALESGNHTIDVDGTPRDYILALPDNYDSTNPYTLIFGWHWRGASMQDVAGGGYYGLENLANDTAIFVSPDGIDDGWANPQGRDIAFTEEMLALFRSEFCIDESRIFSTGFSYGGMMSFAVGCALGDVFRAIAPMAGALYSGCEDGTAPVAVWGSHGYSGGAMPDGVVPIADGREGRDVFLERNGCGTETTPVAPDECVAYQGCQDGYPVTWCEWNGGHSSPPFAGQAIWDFFAQF